jgi:type II secretory pathway component GspD/PulD (secretin)
VILRASNTLFVALLASFASAGCRSAHTGSAEQKKQPLTQESLGELIAKGALRPVDAMNGGSEFKDPTPEPEVDAFARAAAKLGESRAQLPPKPEAVHPETKPAPPPGEQENPYLVFGKRIQVYPESGLIMKPYPLRVGSGAQILKLLQTYGNFPLWKSDGPAQTPDQVRLELYDKLDQELFSDLRKNPPISGDKEDKPIAIADWLVVVAGPERLKEVESFINIFAAGVPQIEIEAKIVEITMTNQLDFGVGPINSTTPIFGFPSGGFVKSLDYNLPNGAGAVNTLLTLGAVQEGVTFNAVLQALAGYENVSIISRPNIAVREGGRAAIENTVKIPTYAISGLTAAGQFSAQLGFEEVGIKLYVIPRVVGTRTVALNIDIEASAQSGTSVTFTVPPSSTSPGFTLTNPTLSKRAAQTVVYLQPGQAVILGGLISERTVDQENKVPLLGDIPLLGHLFKSTFKKKEQTNVLFFLRPRILQGTDLNREF